MLDMRGNVGIDKKACFILDTQWIWNSWTDLILMDSLDMLDKLHMLMAMTAVCTWQR